MNMYNFMSDELFNYENIKSNKVSYFETQN